MATKKTAEKTVKPKAKKPSPARPAKKKTALKKAAAKKPAPKKPAATLKNMPLKKKTKPAPKSIKPLPKKAVPFGGVKPVPKKPTGARKAAIEDIKRTLIGRRALLLGEAGQTMNTLPDQTIFPDLGDQASVESDRNFLLRLRGREQRLLKKIDEALDRIESDTYGICEACGEEIGIRRLIARPVTTMCIECKTEQEEEEKVQST